MTSRQSERLGCLSADQSQEFAKLGRLYQLEGKGPKATPQDADFKTTVGRSELLTATDGLLTRM